MSEGRDRPRDGAMESSEGPRWAADEPTAMWDEQSLREKGYEDAAHVARTATGPATAPSVGGDDDAKVHAPALARPHRPGAAPMAPGLSWPLTVAIAIGVAITVYLAVRTLLH